MGSELAHFEIPAENPEVIAGFYAKVLGWTFGPPMPQFNDYRAIATRVSEGAVRGGTYRKSSPEQGQLNYYLVDSIEEYNQRVSDNGGKVLLEKMSIPGYGYFSVCLDPEGNVFGMWMEDENAS
jgi:hypothetical protein